MNPSKFNPTARFTGLAGLYERGRPGYPEAVIDYVLANCHLIQGMRLIDVGCGTGISSRVLAERGIKVAGIDPNEDMLTRARNTEHPDSSNLEFLTGTAESTGVDSQSCDAVLCAQAFHWFLPDKALAEFHRILKPGGSVILLWNERNESDPFTADYGNLMRTFGDTSFIEVKRGEAGQVLFQTPFFQEVEVKTFANEQVLDLSLLMARAFSTSYSPGQGTEPGTKLAEELTALFHRTQQQEHVTMRYTCSVYTAKARAI
jgi:ubiquinone/menaquinone biosynthesis C-methylase UbiE